MPLDAKLSRLVGIHLGDQRLHENLGAARVELIDHRAQLPVLRLGCRDHQRVGGRIRLDLAAGRCGGCRCRNGCIATRNRLRGRHPRERCAQRIGEFGRIRVLQVDHVDVSASGGRRRLVQALHQ